MVNRKLTIAGIAACATLAASLTLPTAFASPPDLVEVDPGRLPASAEPKVYIVQLKGNPVVAYEGGLPGLAATKPGKGQKINPRSAPVTKYVQYLDKRHNEVLRSVGAQQKIYDYRYALNGFAAKLTDKQLSALKAHPDVVKIWRDEIREIDTDSTPEFLGLAGEGGVWETWGKGEDVIVGIIDTGIWPEHPSFSDQADFSDPQQQKGQSDTVYDAPPSDWHGSCQTGERWNANECNNKLIGAGYFVDGFSAHGHSGLLPSEFLSARDSDGHGSHVASTAAGNEGVINTINDLPISGMAPRARIAAYKVCWQPGSGNVPTRAGCASSDSAKAIDQAVADGVDVINFSIGGASTFFAAPDDIAFLFAADAGVHVATSNGNDGPGAQTVGTPSGVPWITAVGAVEDNESFGLLVEILEPAALANFLEALEGSGPVQLADTGVITADVEPADDGNDTDSASTIDACEPLTVDLTGKIGLAIRGTCSFVTKYNNVAAAGGDAIIVFNDGADPTRIDPIVMSAPGTTIPGVMIGFFDGSSLAAADGVVAELDAESLVSREDRVADFSSRGPNGGALDIIKPDVSAPGVGILAAGTPEPNAVQAVSGLFQFLSGTSMASPHVAGLFALLKEQYPDWSPAAMKSAIMTSARQDLQATFGPDAATPFDIGAGMIVPATAFAPGLVYDAGLFDYLAFTCDNNVQLVTDADCDDLQLDGFSTDASQLNLASIGIAEFVGSETLTRTVTSVTPGTTTFTVVVDAPAGIDVVVVPDQLVLAEGESAQFEVTFTANSSAVFGEWTFGALTWQNDAGASDARSPIAIRPVKVDTAPEVDAEGAVGSLEVPVTFGYTGPYSASIEGLAQAGSLTNSVSEGNTLDAFCVDVPALTHFRFATFDEDTTTPGEDDLDIRLFYADDGCAGVNPLVQVGSSGGVTSEEVIDVSDAPAGGYIIVIDYFAAATGTTIDYTAFVYGVLGDEGNALVSSGPASATAGATETVVVDYSVVDPGRYLGVLKHEDGSGEIARTILDVDAQD